MTAQLATAPILAEPLFPEDAARAASRMVMTALAEGRLVTAYQPVVRASAAGIVAFHECLVRIIDRNGAEIPAATFVPHVEATAAGRLLDREMLRQALEVLKANPRQRLSVNLSALTVGDLEWMEILRAAVEEQPQCGMLLVVEITETAMLELDARALDFLYEIRAMGCSIAIDDFGAGHSTISHLGKFRFDFLKLDGSLIRDAAARPEGAHMLGAIVSMAKHMDLVTVAEMVETEDEIDWLARLGIDCIQGYAIGKPTRVPTFLNDDARISA